MPLAPADLMRRAGGLVRVRLHGAPEHVEEFHAWYAYEHLEDVVTLDGFLSGRRYRSDWLWPKFLALYETADETVEPGLAFAGMIANPTRWSRRIRGYYRDEAMRNNYRRLSLALRGDAGNPYGEAILMLHANAAPGREAEVEAWLAANAEAALALPGCTAARHWRAEKGARRYLELYEFDDPEVLRSRALYRHLVEFRAPLTRHLTDAVQQRYGAMPGASYTR
jgi:hypothetical protein